MRAEAFFMIVTLSIVSIACEYEPVEKNFVQVENDPISAISVNLDQLGDTIPLIAPTIIHYDLEFPKDVRFVVSVTIGDQLVHQSSQLPDSFAITPFQFNEEYLPFRMEVVTSSGTNSLADKLGMEALLFEIEKTVWVEKSPPVPLNIQSIKLEDGNLKIEWERYPKINFRCYTLRKLVFSELLRSPTLGEIFTIYDQNQTSFIDQDYLGGDAIYYLQTQTTSTTEMAEGNQYPYNYPRVKIVDFETVGDLLKVIWRKPSFFNAFAQYRLKDYPGYNYSFFESTNIQDTIAMVENIGFGKARELQLNTTPRNAHGGGGPVDDPYATYAEVYSGDKFSNHDYVFESVNNGLVYFLRENYLYVARETDSKPYDSLAIEINGRDWSYSFGMSHNGQLLYVGSGSTLFQLDPQTLEVINNIDLPAMLTSGIVYPGSIAVGNQNLLAVDIRIPNIYSQGGSSSDLIAIIDGNTHEVKEQIDVTINFMELQGSADLKFLYDRYNLMELSSQGRLVKVQPLGGGHGKGYFENDKLFVYEHARHKVFDLTTLTLSSQRILSENWLQEIYIQPGSGMVAGVTGDGYLRVYDYLTWEEIKHIKLYEYSVSDLSSNYNNICFKNGIVYSGRGFRIRLP